MENKQRPTALGEQVQMEETPFVQKEKESDEEEDETTLPNDEESPGEDETILPNDEESSGEDETTLPNDEESPGEDANFFQEDGSSEFEDDHHHVGPAKPPPSGSHSDVWRYVNCIGAPCNNWKITTLWTTAIFDSKEFRALRDLQQTEASLCGLDLEKILNDGAKSIDPSSTDLMLTNCVIVRVESWLFEDVASSVDQGRERVLRIDCTEFESSPLLRARMYPLMLILNGTQAVMLERILRKKDILIVFGCTRTGYQSGREVAEISYLDEDDEINVDILRVSFHGTGRSIFMNETITPVASTYLDFKYQMLYTNPKTGKGLFSNTVERRVYSKRFTKPMDGSLPSSCIVEAYSPPIARDVIPSDVYLAMYNSLKGESNIDDDNTDSEDSVSSSAASSSPASPQENERDDMPVFSSGSHFAQRQAQAHSHWFRKLKNYCRDVTAGVGQKFLQLKNNGRRIRTWTMILLLILTFMTITFWLLYSPEQGRDPVSPVIEEKKEGALCVVMGQRQFGLSRLFVQIDNVWTSLMAIVYDFLCFLGITNLEQYYFPAIANEYGYEAYGGPVL